MIPLPNNCKCSQLSVFPEDWDKAKANMSLYWYIVYRFYSENGEVKQVMIKGMNGLKKWLERKKETERLLASERKKLENGYNLFLKGKLERSKKGSFGSTSSLKDSFLLSLRWIQQWMEPEEYAHVYFCVNDAIKFGKIENLNIETVTFKTVTEIIENIRMSPMDIGQPRRWSSKIYNYYRLNLSHCFSILALVEKIDGNPVGEVKVL